MHEDVSNAIEVLRGIPGHCLRNVAVSFAQCLADANTWVCHGTINNRLRLWTAYLVLDPDTVPEDDRPSALRREIGSFLRHHFKMTHDTDHPEQLYHMVLVKDPRRDEHGVPCIDGIEMSTRRGRGNMVEKVTRIEYMVTEDGHVVLGEETGVEDYVATLKSYGLQDCCELKEGKGGSVKDVD